MNKITPNRLSRHSFYPPAPSLSSASTSGEVGRTCILFVAPFFLALCVISDVEAMSHFLGNLNRHPTFGAAQGSGPMAGKSPSSSILPVVAHSLDVIVDTLPVAAGLPAPPTNQN